MSADRFRAKHSAMQVEIIAEIAKNVKEYKRIKTKIEFLFPVFSTIGINEQDDNEIIETIDKEQAFIFRQGDEIERISLKNLPTNMLIDILDDLESSLNEAKQFINK